MAKGQSEKRTNGFHLVIGAFSFLIILGVFETACRDDNAESTGDSKIRVVTTLPLFADFVREIGGDRVDVTSLVPNGADPHTWEPAPGDIQRITEADIAFANGLDLEAAAIEVIDGSLPEGAALIKLAESPLLDRRLYNLDNPHIWLDIRGAEEYAREIEQSLGRLDSPGGRFYEENRLGFADEVYRVDQYVKGKLAPIPMEDRALVTTHDAFVYFAAYFRLQIVDSLVSSPGQEPSPEDVARVSGFIQQGVPAFIEPQISAESEILRRLAQDAGVPVCTLYSDSLDDRVTSYIELMRFNADELARCFGS